MISLKSGPFKDRYKNVYFKLIEFFSSTDFLLIEMVLKYFLDYLIKYNSNNGIYLFLHCWLKLKTLLCNKENIYKY